MLFIHAELGKGYRIYGKGSTNTYKCSILKWNLVLNKLQINIIFYVYNNIGSKLRIIYIYKSVDRDLLVTRCSRGLDNILSGPKLRLLVQTKFQYFIFKHYILSGNNKYFARFLREIIQHFTTNFIPPYVFETLFQFFFSQLKMKLNFILHFSHFSFYFNSLMHSFPFYIFYQSFLILLILIIILIDEKICLVIYYFCFSFILFCLFFFCL